ncbi:MAG: hypothetical protein ABW092_13970 [Candidatus Thiodiazotropha sp.]
MNGDAVFWGSMATVAIAVVIIVFLAFKVKSLIKSDAEKHQN